MSGVLDPGEVRIIRSRDGPVACVEALQNFLLLLLIPVLASSAIVQYPSSGFDLDTACAACRRVGDQRSTTRESDAGRSQVGSREAGVQNSGHGENIHAIGAGRGH